MPALAVIGYLIHVGTCPLQRAAIIAELTDPAGLKRWFAFSPGRFDDTAHRTVGTAAGSMHCRVAV
jgi:hypothetical protein